VQIIFLKILSSFFEVPGIFITLCIIMFFYYLKKEKKIRKFLLIITLIVYVISSGWFARIMVYPLENMYPPFSTQGKMFSKKGLLVVLGGGMNSNVPSDPTGDLSEISFQRIYNGFLLYQNLKYPIVVTGGKLPNTNDSPEALKMKETLVRLGVNPSDILLEPQAVNTSENAIYSAEKAKEVGAEKVYLITSAIHMPRSFSVFKKYMKDLEVIPVPVGYLLSRNSLNWYDFFPSISALRAVSMAWHEYAGMIFYITK